jgi:hypothetical protein
MRDDFALVRSILDRAPEPSETIPETPTDAAQMELFG